MVDPMIETGSSALEKVMEGARRATGIYFSSADAEPSTGADPEVLEKAARRRFTAKYKLSILDQADRCQEAGQIGALLRSEGLYSAHLTAWRRQRESGALEALTPRKRGCKAKPRNEQTPRLAELEREVEQLRQRLAQAEPIIDVQ